MMKSVDGPEQSCLDNIKLLLDTVKNAFSDRQICYGPLKEQCPNLNLKWQTLWKVAEAEYYYCGCSAEEPTMWLLP